MKNLIVLTATFMSLTTFATEVPLTSAAQQKLLNQFCTSKLRSPGGGCSMPANPQEVLNCLATGQVKVFASTQSSTLHVEFLKFKHADPRIKAHGESVCDGESVCNGESVCDAALSKNGNKLVITGIYGGE